MKLNKTLAGVAGVILAFGMHSCTSELLDLDDEITLVASTDFFKTSVNVQVNNSNGSAEDLGLGNEDVLQVKIKGPNANDIYFQDGKTTVGQNITSNSGNVAFHLDPNITPSASNPIEFTLVFEADGFISTSKTYKLTQDGNILDKVSLVDISSPPMGVQHSGGSSTLSSGTTTEEITLTTSGMGSGAKLVIAEGTTIKDAEGNPLSGDIEIDMVYFDNEEESSLSVFPGGIMADVTDESGNAAEGTFSSAGFVAIEITDENGNQAATFENNPLEMSVSISNTTYNPETGTSVSAGDVVPVWSYDESNGEWSYEAMDTITLAGDGSLTVTAELEHLSYWNFDWFSSGFCYNVPVTITSSTIPAGTYVYFEAAMYKAVDNTYIGSGVYYAPVGTSEISYRFPAGMDVIIKPTAYNESHLDVTFNEFTTSNLCDGNTSIDVSWSTNNYYTTLDVTGVCGDTTSSDGTEIRPTFYFNYRDITANGPWKWGAMVDGIAYISLNPNNSYEILADYAGESYTTVVSLDALLSNPSEWGDFSNIVSELDASTQLGSITAEIIIPDSYCDQIE